MKRRNFLKTLASLLPTAVVAKAIPEEEPVYEDVMAEYHETYPDANTRKIYVIDENTRTYTLGAMLGTYTYIGTERLNLSGDFDLDEP